VVTRNTDEKVLGRLLVRLQRPRLDYLLLRLDDRRLVGLEPGDTLSLSGVNHVCLEEIRTNLFLSDGITFRVNGRTLKKGERVRLAELRGAKGDLGRAQVRNGSSVLGEVYLTSE
jgi:hypothetical protein